MPQHSHDAEAQAGGVAANKVGGFQQQFCLHHAQFIQQLYPMTEKPFNSHRGKVWSEMEQAHRTHSLRDLPGKGLAGTFCLAMYPWNSWHPILRHNVSLRQYKGLAVLGYQKVIGIWPHITAGSLFGNSVLHKSHSAPFFEANSLNSISNHSKASRDTWHRLQKQQQDFSRIQKAACAAMCQGSFQGSEVGELPETDDPLLTQNKALLQPGTEM